MQTHAKTAVLHGPSVPYQQGAPAARAGADCGHGGARIAPYLPVSTSSPQLHAGLVQVAEAVQSSGGKLASIGVDGQFAFQCDALPALDESPGFAATAEAQRLQPQQRNKAEAVIKLGHV